MSEYLIQETTLTNLAAPIKTLAGSTNAMTIANMQSTVTSANTELDSQEDLLEEIIDKLTGKLLPGADATATAADIASGKTAYVSGNKITGTATTRTSSNLTVSGAAVTAPAGMYVSSASKSVATTTQATPTISLSGGTITASLTQSAGYVAAGTKSATKQLTTKAATTITPSTSSQTAVAANTYCTGAITVGAIPSGYVIPGANQAAKTWTPGTTNQTIAANTYCTGAQTIAGDAQLVASNIKTGVSIFNVTGTYTAPTGPAAGTICKGKEQSWTLMNGYTSMGGGTVTVNYGTSVSAASDGTITINSPTNVNYSSSMDTSVLKGKYVCFNDSSWCTGSRLVLYISSSATFSTSGGMSVDKAQPIFIYNSKI